jgi:pyruvate dehydrogenase E1 component
MLKAKIDAPDDLNPQETAEWVEALDEMIDQAGPDRASYLLERLMERAANLGVQVPLRWNTPYINTIPPEEEVAYPGDRAMERRIKSLVRWNATAMVVRANKYDANIGGHLATYASLATLLEVGYNHFFRGSYPGPNGTKLPGDFVYFQGHASPGVYGRAYLEGRLSEKHLENFRHELRDHPGLSSYPHPWLMPNFWQFPTVSMGLGPIGAIYQARFMRYLENRGIIEPTARKVWAFLGDGECDEPESLGAITLGAREKLDNLIFVVNCNLQRLDGPVRGNGHIIQELEAAFLGAGWNVIKVVWGAGWDDLLARDASGLLIKRMHECVDGEYQTFRAKDGAFLRKEFFGKYPELLKLVERALESPPRRARSRESVQRLPPRRADQRPAHGDPREDGQRLRAGRSRRRPDDGASAEEAHRFRPHEDPRPVRSAAHRRDGAAHRFPPSVGRFRGDEVPPEPARSAGREPA